jgi:hypothetical protein
MGENGRARTDLDIRSWTAARADTVKPVAMVPWNRLDLREVVVQQVFWVTVEPPKSFDMDPASVADK